MSSSKIKTIISCLVSASLLSLVGWYEIRLARVEENFKIELRTKERYIDKIIEDAAKMEREIAKHRFYRSRPLQDDMNSEEFLEVLADYLARDGRCEVKIHKIDWSTWAENH